MLQTTMLEKLVSWVYSGRMIVPGQSGEKYELTDVAFSSIEFESRGTVKIEAFGCNPFSGVGRQLTVLPVSVVEKPAAREVVRFGAESATH